MLFGYTTITSGEGRHTELCLIPRKGDSLPHPIPLSSLVNTENALFMVGSDEGLAVLSNPAESFILLRPVNGSQLFISPDSASMPGHLAKFLKIHFSNNQVVHVEYIQDGGNSDWANWNPNRYYLREYFS